MNMISRALAAVILLTAAALWFWFKALPEHLFRYVLKRRYPLPGTPAYGRVEAKAVQAEPRLWIDTMPYEEVGVMSHDGLALKGWFLPANRTAGQDSEKDAGTSVSAATMILAHGYSGHPRQISNIARVLYEQSGYNILMPCSRGCGFSQGDYIGFGWLDRLDYHLWIDWVKERTVANGPVTIILYGISMGGATVLMTAGEGLPPEVKAVIEDCGYTSVYDELLHQMKLHYHIQNEKLMKRVSNVCKRRAGYSFEEASTLDQVKKITAPVLFIHGDADTFVPFKMGPALYAACAAPKELYVVRGASHGEACTSDPEEYRRRITQFLRKYSL
ncbi:MAG: alpha/beta hydrolase [Treponema sp.]|nr:alpha/beta hydrolase [Treponema sp.]